MIVLTFNVRGLGGRSKRNKLRDLVREHKVDFLAIQETKMEEITHNLCYSIWGNEDCSWEFLPSEGNSGGILSIWRKSLSKVHYTFSGEGFVGVSLEWGVLRRRCVIINVYAKCEIEAKRRLWERLTIARRNLGEGGWCIMGDFNSVGESIERRGINDEASPNQIFDTRCYQGFVRNVELEDHNVVGRRFTWYHPNGRAMSRIDRVLISEEWNIYWGDSTLWVLPRDVSDHCPLVLKVGGWDWGPKPFRFKNFWLENRNIKEVVEEAWNSQNVTGWMGYVLKEKLKGVKGRLREWNREEYGFIEDRIASLKEEIEVVDVRGESSFLTDEDIKRRKDNFSALWSLLKAKDSLMVQRSRVKWLKEGDANTNFFHNCIKARRSGNCLRALKVNGEWVQNPVDVRRAVVDYFRNQVSEEGRDRPTLDGVPFERISADQSALLVVPFTGEELEYVVKESDGNKSPGPDGFNFAFFKRFWYLVKDEFRIMFDQFHANEVLHKSLLAYFVTLIPKISSPLSLKEFRPISLLGGVYKLLAKVLARRLATVMDVIISKSQSAFVKGRNLVDGVLVANEMVDFARKTKMECLVLKVDFEKAYDSVNWVFLEYMMRRLGFNMKWIAWMKACVCGGSMSILVNGSPTEEINIQRGLKQGDPLAPFLFLMVAEGFSGLMRNAVSRNLFEGF